MRNDTLQRRPPVQVVNEFLPVFMISDSDVARRFVAAGMRIRFTGGRPMNEPAHGSAERLPVRAGLVCP